MKKWKIISELKIDDIISSLLYNRGLISAPDIEDFLYPDLDRVTPERVAIDPIQLDKSLKRIRQAVDNKEQIIVYSDYDVDGICAGTIMWETLYDLGANVLPYIPDRVEEGYGLSIKGIDNCLKLYPDTRLIITVDHGISAWDKVDYANAHGIDLIITDHHQMPERLPKSLALVHSLKLSGSGVAWMLARAFSKKSNDFLDLVAIASIADLVPLTESTRILVSYGLKKLNATDRVGLQELITEAGLNMGEIDTYKVSHILSPRLNAIGRLSHAMDGLRLLCTKNRERARSLAQKISLTNRERQILTEQTIVHARTTIEETKKQSLLRKKLLFIDHETYNQGIIGLVAGKLAEEYYLPAIVVARGDVYSKASARSIRGFNIIDAIRSVNDLLVDCGGHPMAAGFTVATDKLPLIQEKLEQLVERELSDDTLTRNLTIDGIIPFSAISNELYDQIKRLQPFGLGNPEPVFATYGVTVETIRLVGKEGRHLKLRLTGGSFAAFDGIAFGLGGLYPSLHPGISADIAFTIDRDLWNGHNSLQLKIKDIQLANKPRN